MSIKSLPENERPVGKTLNMGINTLSNAELLALVIKTGYGDKSAIGLAEYILEEISGGLIGLLSAKPEELMGIRGIGESKACALVAIGELARRMAGKPPSERYRIESACDAANYFMEDLRYEKREHFKLLLMDVKGHVIGTEEISVGGLSSTSVHPREVFSPAIKKNAATIILVHNHPSGDPSPSREDIDITNRLKEVGELVGIKVLDHVVIGDGRYVSLAGEGYIKES